MPRRLYSIWPIVWTKNYKSSYRPRIWQYCGSNCEILGKCLGCNCDHCVFIVVFPAPKTKYAINKLACGNVNEAFGQNIISKYNPECLYPRPVYPFGNNGNLLTGVFVQGPLNEYPSATGTDNVFVWALSQYTWNGSSNQFIQSTNLTGTVEVPVNFYETGLATGAIEINSFNVALAGAMNRTVLPQVNS
jgi:hypothetical protein